MNTKTTTIYLILALTASSWCAFHGFLRKNILHTKTINLLCILILWLFSVHNGLKQLYPGRDKYSNIFGSCWLFHQLSNLCSSVVADIHYQWTVFTDNWPYSRNCPETPAMFWKTSVQSSWGSPPNRCCLRWRCGRVSSPALVGNVGGLGAVYTHHPCCPLLSQGWWISPLNGVKLHRFRNELSLHWLVDWHISNVRICISLYTNK